MESRRAHTILLVENELALARRQGQELSRRGYDIVLAQTGEEAIHRIRANSPAMDLILLNPRLETDTDGVEAAQNILALADIPILFLSSDEDSGQGTERILHYGYVPKGSSASFLDRSIQGALRLFHSRHRETPASRPSLSIEKELVEKRSLIESIIESCPDVIVFALDQNYRYIAFNRNHREAIKTIWGRDVEIGQSMLDIINKDSDRMHAKENFDKALLGHSFVLTEEYGDERLARLYWVDYYSPLFAPDGTVIGLSCFVINNTKQKQAEMQVKHLLEEKELILREVHHRIKNNMNVLFSLLRLQASNQQNDLAAEILNDAAIRIKSMLVLYEKLYRSDSGVYLSLKDYLNSLLREIGSVYDERTSIELDVQIDDIILNATTLSHIGIIINELFTNSIKHAFPGRERGLIAIHTRVQDQKLSIEYRDDGIGIPQEAMEGTEGKGLGMQLVQILAAQMNSSLAILREGGTTISFTVPLSEGTSSPA